MIAAFSQVIVRSDRVAIYGEIGLSMSDRLVRERRHNRVALSTGFESAARFSSSEGRVGETVLLSLLALGEVGPPGANPVTLHGVMRALRRIGLTAPARRIALEAALARGL